MDKRPAGWTSAEDKVRLLELRQDADALLVGKGTLVADRMTMTVPGKIPQPLRCIVSESGWLPEDHPVFQKPGGPVHLCVTGVDVPQMPAGVSVFHGNLEGFLEHLAGLGVQRLHCEGGGQLVKALGEMGAVDEFHCTLGGHTLFGGKKAPTVTGVPEAFLPQSMHYELTRFEPRPGSGECFLSYTRRVL